MLYLQQHVSRFNSAVGCYGATFHYRADVYASISSVITLPHDADAQEIILLCRKAAWKDFSIAFTQQCTHMVTIISVTVTRLMMSHLTHVESDCDNVEAHGGICYAAE